MDTERIYAKLDELAEGQKRIEINLAQLPHRYVPRSEMEEIKQRQLSSRRWVIGNVVAWAFAFGSFWVQFL